VIVRRIELLTGESAILATTGQTFASAAADRGVPLDQVATKERT
jgi:hypothetical protein